MCAPMLYYNHSQGRAKADEVPKGNQERNVTPGSRIREIETVGDLDA